MPSAVTTFKSKAPTYMKKLIADFDFSVLDAAAVMGNIGHESGGMTVFQEKNPTSGRGGWGWNQWTGSRRVQFEAYCKRNGLDPRSDQANYGFLFTELKGSEKAAVTATKKAVGLENKVKAFERTFERAGVKAYASRNQWAKRALAAWEASGLAKAPPPPDVPEIDVTGATPKPKPSVTPAQGAGSATAGAAAGAAAHAWGFDPWVAVLVAVVIGITVLVIWKAAKD